MSSLSSNRRPRLLSKSSSSVSLGKHKPLVKKPILRRPPKPTVKEARRERRESEESERKYYSPDDIMRAKVFPIVEGLSPPELDYTRAKAFLMKSSTITNTCLYSHLVGLLRRVLRQQPLNAADLFEAISYETKFDRLDTSSRKSEFSKPPSQASEQCKMHMEMFKSLEAKVLKPSDDRRPSTDLVLPKKLIEVVHDVKVRSPFKTFLSLLQDYGLGISQEEYFCIYTSLTLFTKTNKIEDIRFWGKIYGRYLDYYIAEAPYYPNSHWDKIETAVLKEDEQLDIDFSLDTPRPNNLFQGSVNGIKSNDILKKLRLKSPLFVPPENPGVGANQYIYFACNKMGEPWVKLPHITPEQLSIAKLIKKNFTGVYSAPVISYPPFPGKEIHLLRAQIARISASTSVSPAGYYRVSEEKLEPSGITYHIERDEGYQGMPLHELEMPCLHSWVHHRLSILPQGRCSWMRPREGNVEIWFELEGIIITDEYDKPTTEEQNIPENVGEDTKKNVEEKREEEEAKQQEKKEKQTQQQPDALDEVQPKSEKEEETRGKEDQQEATEEQTGLEDAAEVDKIEEAEVKSKSDKAETKPEETEESKPLEKTREESEKVKLEEPEEEGKEENVEDEGKEEKLERNSLSSEKRRKSRAQWEESKEEEIEKKSKMDEIQTNQEATEQKSKLDEILLHSEKAVKEEIKKGEEIDKEEFLGVDEVTEGPPLMSRLSEDVVAEGIEPWTIISSSRLLPQHTVVVLRSNLWPGAHVFLDRKEMENIYVGFGVKQDGVPYSPPLPPFPATQYPSNCVTERNDALPDEDVEYQKYLRAQRAIAKRMMREEKYGKDGMKAKKKKKKEVGRGIEEIGPGKEEITREDGSVEEMETSVHSATKSEHEGMMLEDKHLEEATVEEEEDFFMDMGGYVHDELEDADEAGETKRGSSSEEESESEPD